jgi:peptide/nickel transport system permease protein
VLLLAVGLGSLLAPWLTPYHPNALDVDNKLSPPALAHPAGTDALGRDVLSRILHGGRVSLLVGVATAGLSLLAGGAVGALAGTLGGRLDALLMSVVDLALSVPGFFVALLVGYRFSGNLLALTLTLTAVSWMEIARLVRGHFVSLREREFVNAARAAGATRLRIAIRHILPHSAGLLQVALVLILARAVHAEAALSFLGFGVRPPETSWGSLLADARHYVAVAPWLALGPGLVLFLTLWSAHGLRGELARGQSGSGRSGEPG